MTAIREPINQSLPCDEEAEKALLGCMLNGWELNYDIMRDVKPEWFYVPAHRQMFTIICECCAQDVSPSATEISRRARNAKQDDQVTAYLVATCYSACISPGFWRHSAGLMEAAAYRRALRQTAVEVAEIAYDMSNDPAAELDRVAGNLADIMAAKSDGGSCTAQELAAAALEMITANHRGRPGIKTGMQSLDEVFRLWLPGCVHVIAARPGQGKTAFACRLVEAWAIEQEIPSLFVSLEMSREQLSCRMVAQLARVPMQLTLGDLGREITEGENQAIQAAATALAGAPLWVEDRSTMTYRQVVASIRMHVRRYKVKVAFVDYLQLVRGMPKQDAFERIEQTSLALAEVAKSENIVVVALAQLNRESAKRGSKSQRPRLEDLRGSGQIEQDATSVLALHRPSTTVPFDQLDSDSGWESDEAYRAYSECIVLKNRYGQPDSVALLKWIGEQTRFDTWTSHE